MTPNFLYNLKEAIIRANTGYRIGETISISTLTEDLQEFLGKDSDELSDYDYDKLLAALKEIAPNDEIFENAIIEKTSDLTGSSRMEKLDKAMYSLEKMKSIAEIKKWAKNKGIPTSTAVIATAKYDGVSALKNEFTQIAHSRGDGIEGQNITAHLSASTNSNKSSIEFYTIGELIIPRQVFKDNNFTRSSNNEPYKNPRNMVAGLVNHDEVSPYWEFVSHVRYGVADEDFEYSKLEHLALIEKETGFKVPFKKFKISELTTENLDELYYAWGEEYEIDGIVLDINDKNLRKNLGRETNNNPSYAIAYKSDWATPTSTPTLFNDWDVSKEGYVKPVVNVQPFDTEGVTISRATGYNAKFILDNKIGEGSIVEIIRSGSVIPKIVSVSAPTQADIPTHCPSCGTELVWNKSKVEIMCTNKDCEAINIKKLAFFFSSLGVSDFGESIVTKFFKNGYNTVGRVLGMTSQNISVMEGMGTSSATKILTQFDKVSNAKFEKLGHASGCFENLGSRKLKMVVDGLGGMEAFENFKERYFISGIQVGLVNELERIKGVAETTAIAFLTGLDCFETFCEEMGLEIKVPEVKVETASSISFKGRVFVFSGVRDNELKELILENGGDVKGSVSKNTTDMLVKDANSTSAKVTKARDLGCTIHNIEEFKNLI
jgi:NAD-dependent DNA ligase